MAESHLDLSISAADDGVPIVENGPDNVPSSSQMSEDVAQLSEPNIVTPVDAELATDIPSSDVPEGFVLVDGVLIPEDALAGGIEEIEPDVGPNAVPRSGGGSDDSYVLGEIGEGIDITSLLPPTALAFDFVREEELTAFVEPNDLPDVAVIAVDRDTGQVEVDPNATDVSETGLEGGSTEGDGSDTATGTITVDTGGDALGSLVINGQDVTDGGTVAGEFGTLTVTLSDDGTYGFEYVVTTPVDHPDPGSTGTSEGIAEVFEVVVTDEDGDSASDELIIDIVDDGPIARDDSAELGGDIVTVDGDLTLNDAPGADGPAENGFVTAAVIGDDALTLGDAIETQYGTLTIDPDGGYTFDLDTDNADIVALTEGESVAVQVGYTVTDGDGDTSDAVLTLTIAGEDDPVAIVGLDGEVPEIAVDESDLPVGSTPDAPALVQGGAFTISTPDGLADVTVAGVSLFEDGGFLGPVTVETQYGTLTITGFTPDTAPGGTISGGEFTYEFELSEPTADHQIQGTDSVAEIVDVVVTDRDGDMAAGDLDIGVTDDVPTAVDDGPVAVTEGSDGVSGNVVDNDTPGADGASLTSFDYDGETYAPGETITTQSGGELTIAADGSYTYIPGDSVDAGVEEIITYTLTDADGDADTAVLTFVHVGDVNVPEAGGASATLDEDDLPGGLGDMADGDDDPSGISGNLSVDFGSDGAGTIAFVESGPISVGGVSYDVTVSEDGLTLTLSTAGQDVLVAEFSDATSGDYTLTLLQPLGHAGTDPGFEDNLDITLGYVVTDSDGSTATGALDVSIDDDIPIAGDTTAQQDEEDTPVTVDVTSEFESGADGVDLASGVSGELTSGAGTLVYNGDGTFTYTPAPGEDGVVSFDYTVTDTEGDTATATVTLTLQPDSTPALEVQGGTVVDEAGLPGGSSAGDGSDEASGTITALTGGDDVASLIINGVDLTAGGTVEGEYGTLSVTENPDGSYDYSYALTDDVDHPIPGSSGTAEGIADNFAVLLTDSDGDVAESALSIDVLDDGPVALDDAASVGANGPFTVEGNLLANDTTGADGGEVTAIAFDGITSAPGEDIDLDYGTLTVADDGSYTYSLDTTDPDVAAIIESLGEGETLTETVTYTLTDGDGDPVFADLVITIVGEDSGVTISGLNPQGAEITVDEDDLDVGSSPDSSALTQSDSFDVTSPDGLDTVTLGGVALFENGVFTGPGTTVDTPLGEVTITGFDAVTTTEGTVIGGTFTYTYTLQTNALAAGAGENVVSETLELVATDVDGDSATATVDIDIIDDVPTAVDDGPVAVTEGGTDPEGAAVSGDVTANDTAGADGASVTLTSSPETPFGTLELNADGTYTYTPNASVPAGTVDSFTYDLIDGDGDVSSATLTFTYEGDANLPTASGGSALVDEDDLSGGIGDSADGDDDPSASGILGADFGLDGGGTVLFGETADITVNGVTYDFTTSSDGLSVTVSDGSTDVLLVTLTDSTSGAYTVTLLAPLTHGELDTEDDILFDIGYEVTDLDGSVADGTLAVTVDDDLPTAQDIGQIQTGEDQSVTVDVRPAIAGGADGYDIDDITATLTQGLGQLVNNGDGTFTYTPASGETGSVTYTYTVTDADGDPATATVTIALSGDSEPVISLGDPVEVDEDGFAMANMDDDPLGAGETDSTESTSATGTISVFFGNDLPTDALAAFAFSGDATTLSDLNGQGLSTANGALSWSVSADGQTLTGNDGTQDVVTIEVTGATATGPGTIEYSYEVSLLVPLVHPANSLEDTLDLVGIGFEVTDSDSDTSSSSFDVEFVDDVPTANDDVFDAEEAGTLNPTASTSGNVLDNDQIGADADGATVALVGSATGNHGTLTIDADGSFEYVPNGSVNAGEADVFTYTLTDGDGDVSTATITFTFAGDNNAPDVATSAATVDDDGLVGGNPTSGGTDDLDANAGDLDGTVSSEASFTGALVADYGGDGPGSASFINLDGTTQAIGQETITYDWDDATGVLTATITGGARDGVDLFTVTLSAGASVGEYSYTVELLDNVIHAEGPDGESNDVIASLAYTTTDSDGSVETANTLTITFDDDAPSTVDGTAIQTVEDGNVLIDIASLVTAGADGVALSDITAEIDSAPGTLANNGDGTFTFDPEPGQTGVVTITFTAVDGDGDVVTGIVEVTLLPDSPATIDILGDTVVSEAGLDNSSSNPDGGSAAAGDSETTSGTFAVDTGNDTLASLVIDGEDVTAGGTVVGEYGDLVVTVSGGAYSWSYTLRDNTLDHDDMDETGADDTLFDDFAISVTDSDGSTASDTLAITVEDDGPVAIDDVNSITEGATPDTVSGNVITENDTPGADGATVTALDFGGAQTVGTSFATEYGTLSVDADGSYSYMLNNADPRVQALGTGDSLTEVVTYTITDGEGADGDTATATLTITIQGADDGVTINGVDPNAPEVTVDEDDLPDGSSPDAGALTQSNSFGVEALDGLDTVTIEGVVVYENGALTGNVVDTPLGELVVTGFTPDPLVGGEVVSATFDYSYILQTNADHPTGNGENNITENLNLVVTDTDTSSASAVLDVRIIDDVPSAEDNTDSVTEDGPLTASGNVILDAGVDTPGADGAIITAVTFDGSQQTLGTVFTTEYGELTLDASGGYTYELDNANPLVQALGAGQSLTETVIYTLTDGDGDSDTAELTITIHGANDGVTISGLDPDAAEVMVDEDDLSDGSSPDALALTQGDSFTVDAQDGLGTVTLGGTTLFTGNAFTGQGAIIQTPQGEVTITGFTAVAASDGTILGGTFTYEYTLTDAGTHPDGGGENINTETLDLVVTDVDTDSATGVVDIDIIDDVPTAAPDTDSVTEDTDTVATGNVVLASDTPGADGAGVTSVAGDSANVGMTITTAYGTINIANDGSYTYTLDNANADVQALADGETLQEVFSYVLEDADGDASPTTLTITINGTNDAPTVDLGDGVIVDEEGLANGTNPGGAPTTDTDSFGFAAPDGTQDVTLGGVALISNGVYVGDGTTVSTAAFGTVTITGFTPVTSPGGELIGGTFTYSYELTDNTTGHTVQGADEIIDADLDLVVTDTDDESANATVSIDIIDDAPEVFAPETVSGLVNSGTDSATGSLDSFGNFGADDFGTVVFTGTDGQALLDVNGDAVTSGGQPVTLSGFGTGVITASAGGNTVFTVTLSPDATDASADNYTIQFFAPLDDGSGVSFVGLPVTAAGNPRFASVDGPQDTNGNSQDLLFSAVEDDGATPESVNTDSTEVSVANSGPGIEDGEIIRIDFVTDVQINGTNFGNETYDYGQHYTANGFTFNIAQMGNAGQTEIVFRAYDALDNDPGPGDADNTPNGHSQALETGRTQDAITEILVNGTSIDLTDGASTTVGLVTYTASRDSAGDIVIEGLRANDAVTVRTADGFNQIEIENLDDNSSGNQQDGFSIRSFQLEQTELGSPVEFDLDVRLTDEDGDFIDGTLDFTINPEASSAGQSVSQSAVEASNALPFAPKIGADGDPFGTGALHEVEALRSGERSEEAMQAGLLLAGLGLMAEAAAAEEVFLPDGFAPDAPVVLRGIDIVEATDFAPPDAIASSPAFGVEEPVSTLQAESDVIEFAINDFDLAALANAIDLAAPELHAESTPMFEALDGIPELGEMLDAPVDLGALLDAALLADGSAQTPGEVLGDTAGEAESANGSEDVSEPAPDSTPAYMGIPDSASIPDVNMDDFADMAAALAAFGI